MMTPRSNETNTACVPPATSCAGRDHANSLTVDLKHAAIALSDALDLVGVDDVAHGKRIGIMASNCARVLGMTEAEASCLFDMGMLHDVGVSSTKVHRHLDAEFEWARSQEHCDVGYALLRDFAPLAHLALPVRYHHARWDSLVKSGLDPVIRVQANLIHLVDRVDSFRAHYRHDGPILMHTSAIREQVAALSGSHFSPTLVDAFMHASASEAFWLQLDDRGIQAALRRRLESQSPYRISDGELRQLAQIFARIVDAKSRFTAEHSVGVASLSRYIGERMGVHPQNCIKLEIAGLLHDVGKLRIPDEILDKPGPLDESETAIMRTHSYETFVILQTIRGFEEITQWAACHHEQPRGTGYPFHLDGSELSLESRILRVADIFQAMAQDRPYRKGMDADTIRKVLYTMVGDNSADDDVVAAVCADMPAAMAAAMPASGSDGYRIPTNRCASQSTNWAVIV